MTDSSDQPHVHGPHCNHDHENEGEMPGPGFLDLVGIFFNQAALSLGAAPNPFTGQVMINFEAAQESIAFLEMIEEKTQGNLTEEESKTLTHLLDELKMAFVHAVRDPRIQEMARQSEEQQSASEPSRILAADGRPASTAEKPRIIIP